MIQRILYLIILNLVLFTFAKGESDLFYNQLLVNKYAISPAYAGYTTNNELFINYRKNQNGFPNAPKAKSINFNAPIMGKSSFGTYISENTMGIFNYMNIGFSYSYNVQISETDQLFLGSSVEYYKNSLNVDISNPSALNDPYLIKNQNLRESYINTAFGLAYAKQNFNIGFVLPNLGQLYNNLKIIRGYTVLRTHLSYYIPISKSVEFESLAMIEMNTSKSFYYNFATTFKFNQLLLIGVNIKSTSTYGVILGINIYNNILLHYSYETTNYGLSNTFSNNHELSIGFIFGKNNNVKCRKSGFGFKNKNPYYEWIK